MMHRVLVALLLLLLVCTTAALAVVKTVVWTGPDVNDAGAVSADGQYLTFLDVATERLGIRGIQTGKSRLLTTLPGCRVSRSVPSPAGDLIVYSCFVDSDHNELRVIAANGSGDRALYRSKYGWPYHFTADGSAVLVRSDTAAERQLLLIGLRDGSAKVLLADPDGLTFWAALSNDGKLLAFDKRAVKKSDQSNLFVRRLDTQQDVAVSTAQDNFAIAGWDSSRTLLYTRTRAGASELWRRRFDIDETSSTRELMQTLKGETEPLGITLNGACFYAYYPRELDIYQATMDPVSARITSPPQRISQGFPGKSFGPRWLQDGKILSYGASSEHGMVLVIRPYPQGPERVLHIDLSSVNGHDFMPDGTLIALGRQEGTEKPGYFRVDIDTGKVKPLMFATAATRAEPLGGLGIPTFSPDGKILYYRDDQRHAIMARSVETGEERTLYQQMKPPRRKTRAVHPLFDGKWVAFETSDGRSGSVMVVPAAGGTRTGTGIDQMAGSAAGRPSGTRLDARLAADSVRSWPRESTGVVECGGRGRDAATHRDCDGGLKTSICASRREDHRICRWQ
jgi:Tol biopolymer transport system component